MAKAGAAEKAVREIRRQIRRRFSAEEKIRIVLEGLRGEESIAVLCRREGLAPNLYYRWSKEFLEAGKKRLMGDTTREATSTDVQVLRREHARNTEPLSLDQLALELGIHQRTLRAAARTGRLAVQFALRSVFGRPVRYATRAAGVRFMETHYRLFAGQQFCPAPLPSVPADFDERLRRLRRRLGFSQQALAHRVGAAGKAVVYQWESRKRVPSPVFWQKVEQLEQTSFTGRRRAKRISST